VEHPNCDEEARSGKIARLSHYALRIGGEGKAQRKDFGRQKEWQKSEVGRINLRPGVERSGRSGERRRGALRSDEREVSVVAQGVVMGEAQKRAKE